MSTVSNNSGILDVCHHRRWPRSSQIEPSDTSDNDQLSQLLEDLTRVAEVEAAIHSLCITHLARYGITSWGGGDCSINFWCNGVDDTLRWHVSINPIDRHDPPFCLLSVDLGDEQNHVAYGGVVADLRGAGPLLLSHAVVSMIAQALQYEAEDSTDL